MPFYEECLHCGSCHRLSLKSIDGIPFERRDRFFFYEPCLCCGEDRTLHVRYFDGVERVGKDGQK